MHSFGHYPTSNNTYYVASPHIRFMTTAFFVCLGIYVTTACIASKIIPLIVVMILMELILFPYLLWIGAFQRFKVSSEGLYVPNYTNPFQLTLIPWSSMQKVVVDGFLYKILLSDGQTKSRFTCKMERFDQFLEAFRLRRISVDAKEQTMPNLNTLSPPPEFDSIALLPSEERKIRISVTGPPVIFFGTMCVLVGLLFFCLSFWVVSTNAFVGVWMLVMSIFLLILCAMILEGAFNDFVRIKSTGIDFPKRFAKRRLIPWSDILYTRIVEVQRKRAGYQSLRFHARGKDDYVASVPTFADAFYPLLKEITSRRIAILKETESFNPHSSDFPTEIAL